VDSRLIEAGMRRVDFGRRADVTVVNTCTVTAPSDRQSRQLVNRAFRASPDGLVFVMGCWPRFRKEEAGMVADRAVLIEVHEPLRAAEAILDHVKASGLWDRRVETPAGERKPAPTVTRPPLKIQDGCDGDCAYCAVRIARGPSRSTPLEQVMASLEQLSDDGFPEVVLTGINLGSWGRDLDPPAAFADLLSAFVRRRPVSRIRLSSVEPQEMTPALLDLMARPESGICHHLHLPLQSGSDRVLNAMGRPYRAADYADLVMEAAQRMDSVFLGADVIIGLPQEGEKEFAETVDLIRRLPLTFLHVFPFSPRPSTEAFHMKPTASQGEVKRRGALLREMAEQMRRRFWESHRGKIRQAVVESRRCDRTGNLVAITDNFIPVRISGPDSLMGRLIPVRIRDVGDRVSGDPA
jgi:threonylcarbamoyladenosine tRNA methylthiotransferase MtaB